MGTQTVTIGLISDPGTDLQSVDILCDEPTLGYSVVAIHYATGTRYDLTISSDCDSDGQQSLTGVVPAGSIFLGFEDTELLGGLAEAERTYTFWQSAPAALYEGSVTIDLT